MLLFVFIGLAPGASFAAIPYFNTAPEDVARAQGAVAQLGNIGTASGTPLYALTLGGVGLGPLTIALCVFGVISLLLIRRAIDGRVKEMS